MIKRNLFLCLVVCMVAVWALPAAAEEGMWTFDNLPVKQLQKAYGFTPTAAWLDHVRLSSVRFNDGGSGSFISPTGLVLTNHHVALGQLQKMSGPAKDYVKDGFYARARDQEIKCLDLELNVLVDMRNVTDRIEAAARGLNDEAALKARKKEGARLEDENQRNTGMRSDVVTLYHGGEYWLYTYKKYRDVRLVMAPEQQIAFYGGDPDNFTYPRYDLDFAIFRVYENDRPVEAKNFLRVNPQGAGSGELVFVSGHPGSTAREITTSQLRLLKEVDYPAYLEQARRRIRLLETYGQRGPEQARQTKALLFGARNGLKARGGQFEQLHNARIMREFEQRETTLRTAVQKDPALRQTVGNAWDVIASAEALYRTRYYQVRYRNFDATRLSRLAMGIVLYSQEIGKPDGERLEGYHASQLERWKFQALSRAPVYPELEEAMLADQMQYVGDKLGNNDPFVRTFLASAKTPAERAHALIAGTSLQDVDARKALIDGGTQAIAASKDPLIRAAQQLAPFVREAIRWRENRVDSQITPAAERIARARFRLYGKSQYPDATFTLRLSYGSVLGYPMNGTQAPSHTTFYGMYERYYSFAGQPDWALPERLLSRRPDLDLSTPCDFVTTNDIIGGNSGSPVINRAGELVGLVFDGNIESLVGDFVYDMTANRCVAVHSAALMTALRRLYNAGDLADELMR